MFCGFDVSHNTFAKDGSSFGAFVSTMDLRKSTKFNSSIAKHSTSEELTNNIGIHFDKALHAYKTEIGTYPERIIFYRDGVGDGDIPTIMKTELAYIRQKLSNLYTGSDVKFSYIIVNKRINTKFFEERGGTVDNPRPGTVIDDVVTLPERYGKNFVFAQFSLKIYLQL